jgi:hypothetical protein
MMLQANRKWKKNLLVVALVWAGDGRVGLAKWGWLAGGGLGSIIPYKILLAKRR